MKAGCNLNGVVAGAGAIIEENCMMVAEGEEVVCIAPSFRVPKDMVSKGVQQFMSQPQAH